MIVNRWIIPNRAKDDAATDKRSWVAAKQAPWRVMQSMEACWFPPELSKHRFQGVALTGEATLAALKLPN